MWGSLAAETGGLGAGENMVVDGFRPDRWDIIGAAICMLGVLVIMYAPRG